MASSTPAPRRTAGSLRSLAPVALVALTAVLGWNAVGCGADESPSAPGADAGPDAGEDTRDDAPRDTDGDDLIDPEGPYVVVAQGGWDAAEGALHRAPALGAAPDGRAGRREWPRALAAGTRALYVADPAAAGIVAFDAATGASRVLFEGADWAAAVDLVAAPGGALWAQLGGTCQCVRELRDGAGPPVVATEAPIHPALRGAALLAGAEGGVSLGDVGGYERFVVVAADGAPVPAEVQWPSGASGVPGAGGLTVVLPVPRAPSYVLRDAAGGRLRIALPGPPLAVEHVANTTCRGEDQLLIVFRASVDGSTVHVAQRLRADGTTVFEASAPVPALAPERGFASDGAGRLFQLRLDAGGWALTRWEVGCD